VAKGNYSPQRGKELKAISIGYNEEWLASEFGARYDKREFKK